MKTGIILFLVLLVVIAAGCSSGTENPYVPGNGTGTNISKETGASMGILGVWEFTVDPSTLEATVVPVRIAEGHYNVTDMALPPDCGDCLQMLPNSINGDTHIFDIDITLRNHYKTDAYDIRGILETSDAGFKLTNADDWTKLWDYAGGDTINPFLAFATDVDHRKFAIDAEHTRKALIWLPDPLHLPTMVFAIDASWPGNCVEPYTIDNFSQDGTLSSSLGPSSQATLYVDVYDWQDNVDKVTLVAPEITGQQFIQFSHDSGNTWHTIINNPMYALPGDYQVRIIARSSDDVTISLYDYFSVTVVP
jgi:hypothetical protein